MEFLKLVRRRSFLSEVVYIGLNVLFAITLVVVIRTTESIPLAIGLVLLSKWRVLAVRTRFWLANIQTNLVDLIVSVSVVLYLYSITTASIEDMKKVLLLGLVTLLYIGWLVYLKPRSKRAYIVAQAGVALFAGVGVLFTISYAWPASVVVLVMWLIGYGTARHVLSAYEETHLLALSLVWGTVLAEIGWVAYHWTIAYNVPFTSRLMVPQVAIMVVCVGFVAYKAYDSFFHNQKIRTNDVLLPILFTISVIGVLLFFFNGLGTVI
jgi:hypothetical protein